MGWFRADTKITRAVVFSDDACVQLPELPQSDEAKAQGEPVKREDPKPMRVLRADKCVVAPGATVITVRMINSPEQMACSGGIAHLSLQDLSEAHFKTTHYCVVSASGEGFDARTPEEVAKWLETVPLRRRELLGEPVFNESSGLSNPFVFAA